MGNPNSKERLQPLNPCTRNLDVGGHGDIAKDGYVTRQRRPRSRYWNEMVDTDRAERIENVDYGMLGGMDDDY